MIYTPDESARFQAILHAFRDYIPTSSYFDILFSPKCGYIHLCIEKTFLDAERIQSPDELFDHFLNEISNDVRDLFLCGEHNEEFLFPPEIQESRKRILPYIQRLPEKLRQYYTARMEFFFEHGNDVYQHK